MVLEWAGIILLVVIWIYTGISYTKLPESIPVHFGIAGEADRYGGKATVWLLPVIATILFAGISWLNKYPHVFNYAATVTEENAPRLYLLSTRLLRIIKLVIVTASGFINFEVINSAPSKHAVLGWWFIPALFIALLGPTIYFLIQSMKKPNKIN